MNYPEDPCRIIRSHAAQSEQWYRSEQVSVHLPSGELNLGQHTLLLMRDGSMEVIAHHEWASCRAENGISLSSEETYRLFIALCEQFKQA